MTTRYFFKKSLNHLFILLILPLTTVVNAQASLPKINCDWCSPSQIQDAQVTIEQGAKLARQAGLSHEIENLNVLLEIDATEIGSNGNTSFRNIQIDLQNKNTDFKITLAHELGHYFLSQDVLAHPQHYPKTIWQSFYLIKFENLPEEEQGKLAEKNDLDLDYSYPERVNPYEEVFADAFAVFLFKNKSIMNHNENQYRDFAQDYPVDGWEKKMGSLPANDTHIQLSPARSAVGKKIRFDDHGQLRRLALILMSEADYQIQDNSRDGLENYLQRLIKLIDQKL